MNCKKNYLNGLPTPLWRALLFEHRLPARYLLFFSRLHAFFLRLKPLRYLKKEDITFIIAIKNIPLSRIKNSIESIRKIDYDQNLISIIIIDYDSDNSFSEKYIKISKEYNLFYKKILNRIKWNKSEALNTAIKIAKTKYILSTDADIIFEKNYLKEAINLLKKNPYQVILSKCFDLPKNFSKSLDFRKKSKMRFRKDYPNPGINMALTHFYKLINGYDERYVMWGSEDDDIIKRFSILGLKITNICDKSVYFHQWHQKFKQNNQDYFSEKQAIKNKEYCHKKYSIIRNR